VEATIGHSIASDGSDGQQKTVIDITAGCEDLPDGTGASSYRCGWYGTSTYTDSYHSSPMVTTFTPANTDPTFGCRVSGVHCRNGEMHTPIGTEWKDPGSSDTNYTTHSDTRSCLNCFVDQDFIDANGGLRDDASCDGDILKYPGYH
jgi:hypothetical protein